MDELMAEPIKLPSRPLRARGLKPLEVGVDGTEARLPSGLGGVDQTRIISACRGISRRQSSQASKSRLSQHSANQAKYSVATVDTWGR